MNRILAGRIVLCLSVALALAACPPAEEQPGEISGLPEPLEMPVPDCPDLDMLLQDKKVKLRVKDGAVTSNRLALDLCKTDGACKTGIWVWDKSDDDAVTRLEISRTKVTPGAEACFDSGTYSLNEVGAEQSATVLDTCPDKSAWLYDVIPYCGDDPCDSRRVRPLDPGMIIGG